MNSRNYLDLPITLLRRLWSGLTEPFEGLAQAGDHRRATATAAFLLFAIIALAFERFFGDSTPRSVVFLLVAGYVLARTRWFRFGALILIVTLILRPYLMTLSTANPDTDRLFSAFAWVVVPLLLCSLIYSTKVTVLISAANFLALIALTFVRAELDIRVMGGILEFFGSVSIMLIIIMVQRNQIEADRQKELVISQAELGQEIIERERFAEQAKRRADEMAMLNEVNGAISGLQDLDAVLDLIFKQVRKNIPLEVFFIGLYDKDTQLMSFPILFDNGKYWEEAPGHVSTMPRIANVLRSGEPWLLNRTQTEIDEAASLDTNRLGDHSKPAASIMISPLQAGNEVIGVIAVQSYQMHEYVPEQLVLLSAIARQVTVAIENARLFEEIRQHARGLLTLNEVGQAVSELTDLPTLLERIYEQARRALRLDAFYVGLYQPASDEIEFPIMYDEGVRYEPTRNKINEDTLLSRLRLGEPAVLMNRTRAEIELVNAENLLGDTSRISASLMIAPLTVSNQVIGVISAQSYTLNAYTKNDLSLLTGIASQTAVAIHNSRLLAETGQKAQHLSILNEVGRAVAELKDLPDLLEIVYAQGRKSISLDAFFVGLYHPESHEISFPLVYDDGARYEHDRSSISSDSFLDRFLKGEKAFLINRSPEGIGGYKDKKQMLGDDSKPSASILVTPLKTMDKVIGLISAQSYTMDAYDEADLELLSGIANQVSIAIENSRLYTSAQMEIAERQKVEEQLRNAEAKYRELVERAPVVIYTCESGAAGRWFYVSPQIQPLLGFTAEEWIADPNLWFDQIHPEDRELATSSEAEALARDVKVEMDYRMYKKDGQLVWIHDESLNVSISDNQQYVVQGILTDITFRKRAELNLKESEERYQSLFHKAERQARELTLLGEVQNALARELELPILMRTVVEAVAKTFGYTFVSLYVLEGNALRLRHQVGYESENIIENISAREGISGKVVETGRPVLIKDVTSESDFLRASPLIRSEVCVPLFDGDRIFGVLNVESSREYQLTEDDLRLMNVLSEQINIAIRRARLYAERAENLRREQHINEFAHAINSTLDLPAILEIVVRLSVELIGAETGSVSIMSEDGERMTNVYSFNEDPSVDRLIPKGDGLAWLIYERGRSIVLDEYSKHPQALPNWSASGLHAYLGVPIAIGENCLGTLALYNRTADKKFTPRDLSLIEAVAQELAVAIQNVRLFEALQRERDFAVQIMNLLGQGISVSTLDNKYEYVNPALAKMLGYEPAEMIGREIETFLMPDELEKVSAESEHPDTNEATSMEIRVKHKDGHPIHVLTTRVLRYAGNVVTGSITSVTDLSERKQIELERELLLKEMEAKNAELERFTYTVSHDLKSPLVTIAGFLGFLEADIKSGNPEKAEAAIKRIHDAARKMRRLLDELLELSRIGRMANPTEDIPFGELVKEALELAEGQLTMRQVRVQVETDFPSVRVDRTRMIEVLQNLITNASKFMGAQQHPSLEIGMKSIHGQKAFFVKDNGIGVAPEFHERIFGLFNKLDPFSDGTGIGLAIVKRIIEVHGGKIWVESELGEGATFFFTLAENK
jgi:PAS domain S-box-containing protein